MLYCFPLLPFSQADLQQVRQRLLILPRLPRCRRLQNRIGGCSAHERPQAHAEEGLKLSESRMLKIKHTQHIQFAAAVRSSKTDAAALVSALALALALPLALASALALALALALAASFALALAFPSASGLLLASRTRGTRAPPKTPSASALLPRRPWPFPRRPWPLKVTPSH